MSLRSALLLALLLAVSVVAQLIDKYDVFMSVWLNMTPVLQCAADVPSRCFYIPRIDLNIDPTRTLAAVTYRSGSATIAVMDPVGNYSLLRYIMVNSQPWYVVYVPRPGLLYADVSFSIGPPGSGGAKALATSYTVCGRTYRFAYYASPGVYNITPLPIPLYLLDVERCYAYRLVASAGSVVNITAGWYSLYLAELKPTAQKIYYGATGSTRYAYVLNGTLHAYLTYFHRFIQPLGDGFYILQTRTATHVAQTLVMPHFVYGAFFSYRGPAAYDAWNNNNFPTSSGSPGELYIAYNIGLPPGDGYFMAVLPGATAVTPAELAYVSGNYSEVGGTLGYFLIKTPVARRGAGYVVYAERYEVTHLSLADALYAYDTRGVACVLGSSYGAGWALNRLDRAYEIEICNNNTRAAYVALFYGTVSGVIPSLIESVSGAGFHLYMYGDRVEPRNCTRLRWDGAISAKPQLRVYTTPQDVCSNNNYVLSTTSYNAGWRYNLVGNSLVPVGPISPDYNYASQLLELLRWLSQLYRNTWGNFTRYLNATRGANATAFNMTSFYASMPQFVGNIRMESATSTWLRTTLNELQKWRVAAPAVGGAVSVSLQAPSALTASAAAVAVATAWAVSRRSLATAAFLAGFAILATALFVAALYGATITAALVMAAVILMSIGAAAAWQKQTGEE